MFLSRLFLIAASGFSVLVSGCNNAPAVVDPAVNQPAVQEQDQKKKDGGLNFDGILKKATDLADGVQKKGGEAAEDTGEMITDMFNTLKDQGATQATNAAEWATQDFKNINAWEYKVLPVALNDLGAIEKKLNELGVQRWECFNVQSASNGTQTFYFKRQKKSYLKSLPLKDVLKLVPMMGGDE